jgi:hypothetical protein
MGPFAMGGVSMNLGFRLRRRARIVTDTGPSSGSATVDSLFRVWQKACADLRAAEEEEGKDHGKMLALAVEVIRSRNALTREQIATGWTPSAAVLRGLVRDEQLVREADDRGR